MANISSIVNNYTAFNCYSKYDFPLPFIRFLFFPLPFLSSFNRLAHSIELSKHIILLRFFFSLPSTNMRWQSKCFTFVTYISNGSTNNDIKECLPDMWMFEWISNNWFTFRFFECIQKLIFKMYKLQSTIEHVHFDCHDTSKKEKKERKNVASHSGTIPKEIFPSFFVFQNDI